MQKPFDRPKQIAAVKTLPLVRVTLNDSFRITCKATHQGLESIIIIVQPAAKIQSPEPRVDN